MRKINVRILSLFIFIIVAWGLSWPINKMGLDYLSPAWYTAIRLIIGTATMMTVSISIKKFSLPTLRDLPLILVIGIIQIFLYILLVNIGLTYLPAGRASLLAYTTPLWVMPIATLFFYEESGVLRWFGFLLGIAGLLILLSPWEIDWHDRNALFGAGMLLLASFCWAVSMICIRYMRWYKSPVEIISWQLLVGTIPIVIYAYLTEPATVIVWNSSLILSLLYTGALVTGISYWSGLVINKELPTIIVSLGFLVVPVCSLMISSLFMHEAITAPMISAMSLIMMGLVCVVI